jgi:hypothetical protein
MDPSYAHRYTFAIIEIMNFVSKEQFTTTKIYEV